MFTENKYEIQQAVYLCRIDSTTVVYVPHDGHIPYISVCPKGKFKEWIKEIHLTFPKEEGWKFIPTNNQEVKKSIQTYINNMIKIHNFNENCK